MKNAVLGKDYVLSVVIVGDARSQALNNEYRGKNVPTDILSFQITSTEGEIFLNLKQAKIKAREFDRPFENFVGFLFIHGLFHLKGLTHGSTMERKEEQVRKKFRI